MFSDERERVVVVVSGFDDDSDSVARRGEETVREPRAKSSANGTSVVYFFFLLVVFDRERGCLGKLSDSARKFFFIFEPKNRWNGGYKLFDRELSNRRDERKRRLINQRRIFLAQE
jgi:hypothetical protein